MQIYLLQTQDGVRRIYAQHLGTLRGKVADYSVYMDYKGQEWLHIYVKNEETYILWPFYRLGNGSEYLEYLART